MSSYRHLATNPSLADINPFSDATSDDIKIQTDDKFATVGDRDVKTVYNAHTKTVTVFSDRLQAAYVAERAAAPSTIIFDPLLPAVEAVIGDALRVRKVPDSTLMDSTRWIYRSQAAYPFFQAQGRADSFGTSPQTSLISAFKGHLFFTLQRARGSRIIVFAEDSFIDKYNRSILGDGEFDSQLRKHLMDEEITGLSLEDRLAFAETLASTRDGFDLVSIGNSQAVIKEEMRGRA